MILRTSVIFWVFCWTSVNSAIPFRITPKDIDRNFRYVHHPMRGYDQNFQYFYRPRRDKFNYKIAPNLKKTSNYYKSDSIADDYYNFGSKGVYSPRRPKTYSTSKFISDDFSREKKPQSKKFNKKSSNLYSDRDYYQDSSEYSVEDSDSSKATDSLRLNNESNPPKKPVVEKWIPTKCSERKRKSTDRYSSSFVFNKKKGLNEDAFPNPGEAVRSSSVFVGEDVTLCWIETITIKEDKSIQPPKKVVLREFTISFENSATIPEKYLECGKLEGELEPGCHNHQGKTGLFDVVDEDSKVSKLVNFTTISTKGNIEIRQHKNVRCAVGPVVTKNVIEFRDGSKKSKKRVEIKVSPRMRKIDEDGESCSSDEEFGVPARKDLGDGVDKKMEKFDAFTEGAIGEPFGGEREGNLQSSTPNGFDGLGENFGSGEKPFGSDQRDVDEFVVDGTTKKTPSEMAEEDGGTTDNIKGSKMQVDDELGTDSTTRTIFTDGKSDGRSTVVDGTTKKTPSEVAEEGNGTTDLKGSKTQVDEELDSTTRTIFTDGKSDDAGLETTDKAKSGGPTGDKLFVTNEDFPTQKTLLSGDETTIVTIRPKIVEEIGNGRENCVDDCSSCSGDDCSTEGGGSKKEDQTTRPSFESGKYPLTSDYAPKSKVEPKANNENNKPPGMEIVPLPTTKMSSNRNEPTTNFESGTPVPDAESDRINKLTGKQLIPLSKTRKTSNTNEPVTGFEHKTPVEPNGSQISEPEFATLPPSRNKKGRKENKTGSNKPPGKEFIPSSKTRNTPNSNEPVTDFEHETPVEPNGSKITELEFATLPPSRNKKGEETDDTGSNKLPGKEIIPPSTTRISSNRNEPVTDLGNGTPFPEAESDQINKPPGKEFIPLSKTKNTSNKNEPVTGFEHKTPVEPNGSKITEPEFATLPPLRNKNVQAKTVSNKRKEFVPSLTTRKSSSRNEPGTDPGNETSVPDAESDRIKKQPGKEFIPPLTRKSSNRNEPVTDLGNETPVPGLETESFQFSLPESTSPTKDKTVPYIFHEGSPKSRHIPAQSLIHTKSGSTIPEGSTKPGTLTDGSKSPVGSLGSSKDTANTDETSFGDFVSTKVTTYPESTRKYSKGNPKAEGTTELTDLETDSEPNFTNLKKGYKSRRKNEPDDEDVLSNPYEQEPTSTTIFVESTIPSSDENSQIHPNQISTGRKQPIPLMKTTSKQCSIDDANCKSTPPKTEESEKCATNPQDCLTSKESRRKSETGEKKITTLNPDDLELITKTTDSFSPKHKLGLRIRIVLEQIDEDEENKNLVEVDKHLLLDDDAKEHNNRTILNQIKALNDSVTAQTIRALLNCSTLERLSKKGYNIEVDEASLVPKDKVGSKHLEPNELILTVEDKRSDDEGMAKLRKKRDIDKLKDVENHTEANSNKNQLIKDCLPDLQKDINTGMNHVISKLNNCTNSSCFTDKKDLEPLPISDVLGIISDPKDSRIYERTKRDVGKANIENLDRWSKERIRRNADGYHIRSLAEFTIFRET